VEGQKITYFGVCLLLQNWHISGPVGELGGKGLLPYLFFVVVVMV